MVVWLQSIWAIIILKNFPTYNRHSWFFPLTRRYQCQLCCLPFTLHISRVRAFSASSLLNHPVQLELAVFVAPELGAWLPFFETCAAQNFSSTQGGDVYADFADAARTLVIEIFALGNAHRDTNCSCSSVSGVEMRFI